MTLIVLAVDRGRLRAQAVPAGGEFAVNSYTTSYQYTPALAADPAGGFVVVWASYGQDGSYLGVVGRRYSAVGAPLGGEFAVNTSSTRDQEDPHVAIEPGGSFTIVWLSKAPGFFWRVVGRRYSAAGTALGGEFVVNPSTTYNAFDPDVTADSAGGFVVVWTRDAPDEDVVGRRYGTDGTPLGGEFVVNTYTTGNQYSPVVVASPQGGFIVVWTSGNFLGGGPDGSTFGIRGQRYASTGAPLGGEFAVNTYTTGAQYNPALAVDPAGGFVVVWASDGQDGSGYGVVGRRYSAAGTPLGGEFVVNTYTTSDQKMPAVTTDPEGGFVVVWASYRQDGSSFGVVGRRYLPPPASSTTTTTRTTTTTTTTPFPTTSTIPTSSSTTTTASSITTTTTLPISTTTLPPGSTTTTTVGGTTTTTTLPGGPTFATILRQVTGLVAETQSALAAAQGAFRIGPFDNQATVGRSHADAATKITQKLLGPLDKAIDLTDAATAACVESKTKKSKSGLKKVAKQCGKYVRRLSARSIREAIPDVLRGPLEQQGKAVESDALTLRSDVSCPVAAPASE